MRAPLQNRIEREWYQRYGVCIYGGISIPLTLSGRMKIDGDSPEVSLRSVCTLLILYDLVAICFYPAILSRYVILRHVILEMKSRLQKEDHFDEILFSIFLHTLCEKEKNLFWKDSIARLTNKQTKKLFRETFMLIKIY